MRLDRARRRRQIECLLNSRQATLVLALLGLIAPSPAFASDFSIVAYFIWAKYIFMGLFIGLLFHVIARRWKSATLRAGSLALILTLFAAPIYNGSAFNPLGYCALSDCDLRWSLAVLGIPTAAFLALWASLFGVYQRVGSARD